MGPAPPLAADEGRRRALLGGGGTWFASRVANGALALAQITIVLRVLGPDQAGRFFLVWTAAWLLATVLRFGADGILPRVVAEARAGGTSVPVARPMFRAGLLAAVAALPIVLAVLRIPIAAEELALTFALALAWAPTFACSALLKAHGRVALSGIVANLLWPLGSLLAVVVVSGTDPGWAGLALATFAFATAVLLATVAITAHALGSGALGRLVAGGGPSLRVDADVAGAATLALLYELVVWIPVVFAALAGVGEDVAGGVFAAARVAGVFSWGYGAVVAALTPQIAAALATRRIDQARRILLEGSVLGTAVTLPVVLAGALAAEPILSFFDPGYESLAMVLTLLAVARLLDAMAGPVGEALLVGRRTWLDAGLLAAGITLGAVLTGLLHPEIGTAAIGVGAAAALGAANLLRIGVVARLLSAEWAAAGGALLPSARQAGYAVVVTGCSIAVALRVFEPTHRSSAWVVVVAALLVAGGTLWFAAARHGARAALTSPLAIVSVIALGQFALRPASLIADPGSATFGLRIIGFAWADVMAAGALGVAGLGLFALAFILAWRPHPLPSRLTVPSASRRRLVGGLLGAIAVGTLLWGVLFTRLGGLDALAEDPTTVHLSQFGAGYGTVGLMLCLGAVLVALWVWLREPSRAVLVVLLLAALTSFAGSVALATRGPLMVTVLAAFSLVLAARRPSGRRIAAGVAVVVVVAGSMLFLRAVRDYSLTTPLRESVQSVAETPPLRLVSADLIEFDHLVALEQAVPGTLPWLNGSSIADTAGVFVPRKLWPDKPEPVDFRLSEVMFGLITIAGTPFTLPGELYWNFRFAGALLALVLLGLAAGRAWGLLQRHEGPMRELTSGLLFGYSYLLLTRPFSPMVLTTAMGLFGVIAVAAACGLWSPRAAWSRARAVLGVRVWAPLRALAARALRPERIGAEPAFTPPPGSPRFPLVDSVRALAALSVLGVHVAGFNREQWWNGITGHLYVGVTIFFVVSGFLLYRPYAAAHLADERGPSLRDFYRRRVLRIVPGYWVALTIIAIYPGLYGAASEPWLFYGFAQIYNLETFNAGLPVAWTLCIEATFYLVLPFYAMALWQLGRRLGASARVWLELATLLVLGAAAVWLHWALGEGHLAVLGFPGRFDWFALGMVLAVVSAAWARRPREHPIERAIAAWPTLCWVAAAAAYAALTTRTPGIGGITNNLLEGTVGLFVVMPAVIGQSGGGLARRVLRIPALAWIGLVSYALYLWQEPLARQFLPGKHGVEAALVAVALIAALLVISAASYYLIERPFLLLKDRRPRLRRRRPARRPRPAEV